ncbi:hypothetical protein [Sphingomonas bisphenolicum]|uniref:Uncharacterized protein n=1 Tax=Sphingomonas bisphenolicum TaxID=296544 RepID=A0ABN5W925_9SPHN|nr:hypothetical protein [Sphingomonas bisphenolicum]BBF68784.1 hypothetical protein SBA_ch1_09840 [Sphingomonas bisphenolicum]
MPSIRNSIDRLAAWLAGRSHVTLRFTVHQRLAPIVEPLIERLLLFDDDGETYRCSISHWTLNERPVLHTHRGVVSTLRVDGPLQDAGRTCLPLGGLIEAPHVTAHLDPIAARQLDNLLQDAIDEVIQNWIIEHGLYDQPRQRREIDRRRADREAKRIIAAWVSDATADASGEACREGSEHA